MEYSQDDLRDFLLNELSPARRAEIEELLRRSPAAREDLESQRRLLSNLRTLPEVPLPHSVALASEPRRRRWGGRLPRFAVGSALPRLAAAAAVLVGAIWIVQPSVSRDASGWTLAFGAPPAPPALSEERLRAAIRDELARSEVRWRRALLDASQAGREASQAEFDELRRELAEFQEDAIAGYEFVNAKHEQLKRQLFEFDLASAGGGLP